MEYRDDEDILCGNALTRRMEAENKKRGEVKWQNMTNIVCYEDENGETHMCHEVCMNCKHCSDEMHPYSKLRTTFGDPHGATTFLCGDIDMHLCKKHGFSTWEHCWCPNYEKGNPKDKAKEIMDEKIQMLTAQIIVVGFFLLCVFLVGALICSFI